MTTVFHLFAAAALLLLASVLGARHDAAHSRSARRGRDTGAAQRLQAVRADATLRHYAHVSE